MNRHALPSFYLFLKGTCAHRLWNFVLVLPTSTAGTQGPFKDPQWVGVGEHLWRIILCPGVRACSWP